MERLEEAVVGSESLSYTRISSICHITDIHAFIPLTQFYLCYYLGQSFLKERQTAPVVNSTSNEHQKS